MHDSEKFALFNPLIVHDIDSVPQLPLLRKLSLAHISESGFIAIYQAKKNNIMLLSIELNPQSCQLSPGFST